MRSYLASVSMLAVVLGMVFMLCGCPVVVTPQPEEAKGAGLNVEITGVVIPEDLMPELTFVATDDDGDTVPLSQFVGSSDVRFTLAFLEGSGAAKSNPVGQYFCYIVDAENGQATYDHHLAEGLSENTDGSITYKFETALPANYDQTATHQAGGQLTRTAPSGTTYDTNVIYTWRPDGEAVAETRELVTTEACNACHTKLTVHGRRTEIQYCILCHTPQTVDPDTGNTVDMPYMVHQIHMGANLPSGEAYRIIGYRGSEFDASEVHMPQAATNCTMCHVEDAEAAKAPHGDSWKTNPGRVACGACHDDIDFAAGTGHLAQTDDSNCAGCHSASAIEGYHIQDYPKIVLETTVDDISWDEAGLVTVTFTAADTDGNAITDLENTDKYRVGYLLGWPAAEYQFNVGNSGFGGDLVNNGGGSYTYTETDASQAIPVDTAFTFGFTFRGRSHLDLNGDAEATEGESDGYETRWPMEAPATTYFTTNGDDAVARRVLVDDEACAKCHGEPFPGHGSDRIGVGVCLVCHNTTLVSEPDDTTLPVATVNMKDMIHKIHRGAELESGYTTGGHSGDVDFTYIHFPGRLEQCSICHGEHSVALPLSEDALSTIVDGTELAPATAACTGCHDAPEVYAHASDGINSGGAESCEVCHSAGGEFDPAMYHVVR